MIVNNKFIFVVQGFLQSHEEAPRMNAVRNNLKFQLLLYEKNDDHNNDAIQINSKEENIRNCDEVDALLLS